MKRALEFDPDFEAKSQRRPPRLVMIGLGTSLVLVCSVLLAVVHVRRTAPALGPALALSQADFAAARNLDGSGVDGWKSARLDRNHRSWMVQDLEQNPAAGQLGASRRDRFVIEAPEWIDAKMVVRAPARIDPTMVVPHQPGGGPLQRVVPPPLARPVPDPERRVQPVPPRHGRAPREWAPRGAPRPQPR
jgi:hypothetical protein